MRPDHFKERQFAPRTLNEAFGPYTSSDFGKDKGRVAGTVFICGMVLVVFCVLPLLMAWRH